MEPERGLQDLPRIPSVGSATVYQARAKKCWYLKSSASRSGCCDLLCGRTTNGLRWNSWMPWRSICAAVEHDGLALQR